MWQKTEGGLEFTSSKKLGLQSYSHKEINTANNPSGYGIKSFPVESPSENVDVREILSKEPSETVPALLTHRN